MIDWNDNAKAAVEEFACYIGRAEDCEQYFNHIGLEKTKTVADAVDWHKSKGWGVVWASEERDCITYGIMGFAFANSNSVSESRYIICTRAEFEAYVKEQEGEKWTHYYCGEKCKIIGEPDSFGRVVILTESDAYFLDKPENLKPIKPTITKAQAWDMLSGHSVSMILDKYDII